MTRLNEETKKALESAIDRLKAWSNDPELDLNSDDVLTLLEHYDSAALSQSPQGAMTDKELRDWIFQWSQNEGKTPLESDINDLIWTVQKAAPQPETGADDLDKALQQAIAVIEVSMRLNPGGWNIKDMEDQIIRWDALRTRVNAARKVDAQTKTFRTVKIVRNAERFWVRNVRMFDGKLIGQVDNHLLCGSPKFGDIIELQESEIIEEWSEAPASDDGVK